MNKNDVIKAYATIRKSVDCNSIPDEVLDFMKTASLEQLDRQTKADFDPDQLRYKTEPDKNLIYDSTTDRDLCMFFSEDGRDFLLNTLNCFDIMKKVQKTDNLTELRKLQEAWLVLFKKYNV